MKRMFRILLLTVFFAFCLTSCGMSEAKKERRYEAALAHLQEGAYEEAYGLLEEIGDYRDAKTLLSRFRYLPTEITWKAEEASEIATFSYNDRFLLTQRTATNGYGHLFTWEYAYDEQGNTTKMVGPNYPDYGENSCTCVNTYDEKGRLAQRVATFPEGGSATFLYTYDAQDRLTEERAVFSASFISVRTYTYDTAGRLTKYAFHHTAYDNETNITYIYDEKGNLIKETKTNKNDTLYTYEYTYDKKGNLTKKLCELYDHTIATYKYFYDKEGKTTKKIYTTNFSDTATAIYTYDEANNKVTETQTDGEGRTQTATISYTLVYFPNGLPLFFEEMLVVVETWWDDVNKTGYPHFREGY